MKLSKFIIKVVDEQTDTIKWCHVCYISTELYESFMEKRNATTDELNDYLHRWIKEDLNIELSMSSKNDIIVLKQLIRDYYKTAYPLLVIDSSTDRQGWLRVWITKKMKEDIGQYGEESF